MFRTRRILLVLTLLACLTPVAFFAYYERFSDHLEQNLGFDDARANAAKHAYAAAQVYSVVRAVGFSPDSAELIVLALGEFTEYMETIFKTDEPDSTREIMKDMYNNQVGILVAEWVRGQEKTSIRETIVRLAKSEVLAVSSYKVPMSGPESIEDYPESVRHASRWFCEQQQSIKVSVGRALAK